MIKEICIVGQPSLVGGADTELTDQIVCWKKMGLTVYILPTQPLNPINNKIVTSLDCKILKPRMWNECTGMHVISFCNGSFLDKLPEIKKHAKTTTFVNCMTWNFPKEIEMQHKGMIDFHLYQTDHAMIKVSRNLEKLGVYRPIRFDPYFDSSRFTFVGNRPTDHFRYGRISRSDMKKYNIDQFMIYKEFKSPVPKSGVILGWGTTVAEKFRNQEIPKEIQIIKSGGTSAQEFYKFCDVLCSKNDTFENLPRVGMEAMASGSILVVDNRGGWEIEVDDGVTGFLCNTTEEFIEKMTFLAYNADKKEEMRFKAKEKIDHEWGFETCTASWENVFEQWENLIK